MAVLRNHILVPVDFSEQSFIALGQSYNLARLTKATLTLLYVIEESFQLPIFKKKKEDKSMEKKIRKELEKLAHDTTEKSGIKVETMIARGKVYEEIQKAARKLKCSFIVMGTSGGSGIKKFIGSNSLRVIRESPCPVITIRGKKHRLGCKHIVLPLDLTKETKEKVMKGIEIARLFGSVINLITVLTSDDEFIVNKLKRQMDQVHDFIKQHDVSCSVEYIHGSDISDEVVKYARKIKSDLILIMTQEEMNWTNMFISSEAQEIINGTDIPVLSIRPVVRKNTTLSVFEY
ncbi:MAG: universal stress protein [Bacteroidetes bacterium]|nr:universal stress protein [Bacteroidota bacterium]